MGETITIVWNDWMSPEKETALRKMGTMPEDYETDVSAACEGDGRWAAELVAKKENEQDCENFHQETEIIIVKPDWAAGRYVVYVDYEPCYTAGLVHSPTTAAG